MSLESFIESYIETALWSSTDEEGESLDIYQDSDIAPETLASMRADCEAFYEANREDWESVDMSDERAGHNFWLNRNGHGAGFWDEGTGEAYTRLSKASKCWGTVDLFDEGGVVRSN